MLRGVCLILAVFAVPFVSAVQLSTILKGASTALGVGSFLSGLFNQNGNFAAQTDPTTGQFLTSAALATGASNEYLKVIRGSLTGPDFSKYFNFIVNSTTMQPQSYWHDIPMFANANQKTYNMIVEIPRGQAALTLMNLSFTANPITFALDQFGNPLEENVDYIHNFGKLPQTYVPAGVQDSLSGLNGNGKPLDVVEISDKTQNSGDVVPVKILGMLGVTEINNEVDYKLIAIDTRSAFASQINSLADVDAMFPDLLAATRGYFRFYRFPEQVNQILNNGNFWDADTASQTIQDKHQQWQSLIQSQTPPNGIETECHQPNAAFPADDSKWLSVIQSV